MTDPLRRALVVVDVQNDFCPGGALAVQEGDAVAPVINRLMPFYDVVVATQDWHPADHISFAFVHGAQPFSTIEVDGVSIDLWPAHCVAGTNGADFHPALDTRAIHLIVRKGERTLVEEYSGFADPGLPAYLRARGITALDVVGLAFDYCVKNTAMDARTAGFEVRILADATRAVFPDREDEVHRDLEGAGVEVTVR